MKTSKKLLSFFLAAVMAVTSCSVGFTAFAAEKNKSIWSTACEAKDAYATLNELANMLPQLLLGIDAISKPMYEKYAKSVGKSVDELTDAEKEEVAENATIPDLLGVLQPTLVGAIAKTSQSDYAKMIGSGRSAEYYDYLLGREDSVNFFTLYGLCDKYMDSKELSKESRETLKAWKAELDKIADLDNPADAYDAAVQGLLDQFESAIDDESAADETALMDLQMFYSDEFFATVDADTIQMVKATYPKYQELINNYGLDIKLDTEAPISESFPLLVYYALGSGLRIARGTLAFDLASQATSPITFKGEAEITGFESILENFADYAPEGSVPFEYNIAAESAADFYKQAIEQFSAVMVPTYKNLLADAGIDELPQIGDNLFAIFADLDGAIDLEPEEREQFDFASMSAFYSQMIETISYDSISQLIQQNYRVELLAGILVKYSDNYSSVSDVENTVFAKMPQTDLTDDEIMELASALYTAGNKSAYAVFTDGKLVKNDFFGIGVNYTLPKSIKGTALAEYLGVALAEDGSSNEYTRSVLSSFFSEYFNGNSVAFRDLDGNPLSMNNVVDGVVLRYEGSNLPVLNFEDASFDREAIEEMIYDAMEYTYASLVNDEFEVTIVPDENSGVRYVPYFDVLFENLTAVKNAQIDLTEEQQAILNGDYDLTGTLGTEIVNTALNSTIGDIVDPESTIGGIITPVLEGLLGGTNVDLQAALIDIWARINDDAVKTVFELLPLLVTFVEALIVPIVVNDDNGTYNNFLGTVLSAVRELLGLDITGILYDNGSEIGATQLSFDLNRILPAVLHWLADGKDSSWKVYGKDEPQTIEYYSGETKVRTDYENKVIKYAPADIDTADVRKYTVKDENGNILSRSGDTFYYLGAEGTLDEVLAEHQDALFTYEMTYDSSVPFLTGIYIADKALKDAELKDLPKLLGKAIDNEQLANALSEVIVELATLFTAAVDEFVASDRMIQAKFEAGDTIVSTGLNLLFTAIPQLFDIMENLAAEKYNIPKDNWTYCYEGKIGLDDVVYVNPDNGVINSVGSPTNDTDIPYIRVTNNRIEKFKEFAGSNDPNRSIGILDLFAEILVEDWIDAILSLVNGVVATDNVISNNIPIISGLLNALGGFGEESILTDVFNSIFQLTRDSEYSFTFAVQDNGLTGLSKENAYFLITNVERLVEVVKNLIAHFGDNDDSTTTPPPADDPEEDKEESVVYKPKAATNAKASSHNYTSSELSNAKDLIGNLDEMLSSLLSDSTLNGFSLSSTENILAGVVSLLDRFLGMDVKLDSKVAEDIVKLVNKYLYVITGKSENLTDKNHQVDAKKVYSNNALTGLVVETYALIEEIVDMLLVKFYDSYDNNASLKYNLLVEAIDGVISPDAVGIRLDDYADAQKSFMKYDSWLKIAMDSSRNDYKNLRINWGFKDGDKEGFFDGFAASLRLVSSVLGVLLIDTGWYDTVLTPVLGIFCTKNGIKLTSYSELVNDKNATGYYDATLLAIIESVSGWLNALLDAPATTLIKTIQGVAGLLDEKNTKAGTIKSIIDGVIAPITAELKGLGKIFGYDPSNALGATSVTLQSMIDGLADKLSGIISFDDIKVGKEPYTYTLTGDNIIPIVNSYLASTGITLKKISWSKIYSSTPEAALVYVIEYAIETLLDNDNLMTLLEMLVKDEDGNVDDELLATLLDALRTSKLDAVKLLGLINKVLEISDSPTLAYWTFTSYLQELTENFKYPAGVTKAMANEGVEMLDNLVAEIFPLLGSFGVNLGADDLQGILNSKLFTNDLLTKIATGLYGALDGLDPSIKTVLSSLGLVSSTADVAKILTDKSYGQTFSSAANTIKAQTSWANVKNVNWGFTDGSSKAQQGFVNALVAILRPLNNVLAVFLNEGSLQLDDVVYELISTIEVPAKSTTLNISGNISAKITYSMSNGVFTVKIDDASRELSVPSTLKLDLKSLKNLNDLKIVGTNGYNSAIIPLLEAFKCSGIKTYSQYRSDVKTAKDNLLLDVLNPILGDSSDSLLNKLTSKPFATLTDILPNIAMFIDAHGLSQLINNLLAPVTGLVSEVAKTLNLNGVIKEILGTDLGSLVADLLGVNVKINIDLTNLSTLNIEDLIIPIVRMVLAGSDNKALANLKLYDINWNALISLGTKSTYTSKATGADGNFLTGKTLTDVDNGKVLITVLRYIGKTLVNNMSTIKSLVLGIDAVKKSDILSSVLASVFNTLSTSTEDQIIASIFYLVSSNPKNAFWDYTGYKTGEYEFAYPEGMDTEFLKSLPPMIDGLVGGIIDLNDKISGALFKDELISKLATGLYGAIEKVKVGDGSLTALLAKTNIDFSTANVAKLLVDEAYGQKFEGPANVIKNAGSWANVKVDSLKWGVTDRDSFFHALVAVLRPIYGVLDVLLNDAYLGIFDLVRIPGSNGYTSSIVPLMEAFSMYNIKTQYQYREDISKEYDAILLDIINPIWDKVEDILAAPLQTIAAVVPNLALFLGNDGLCQILDNLLAPISALADAIRPIVDLNDLLNTLLDALDVDINGILAKIGVKNFSLDVYDLNKTLKPILAGDSLIPLINSVLGMIKIGGSPLGLKLNDIDWLQLASHGKTIVSYSQAATYGARIFVEGDSAETLIAVLRYLINTINTGDNLDKISGLIGGLLGDGVPENISGLITQVLGMLKGDADTVIASLVDLLSTFA